MPAARMAKSKPVPAYEATAWGIRNHMRTLWTWKTFDTQFDAQQYIDDYQARNKHADLSRHQPVPVRVVVTVAE